MDELDDVIILKTVGNFSLKKKKLMKCMTTQTNNEYFNDAIWSFKMT